MKKTAGIILLVGSLAAALAVAVATASTGRVGGAESTAAPAAKTAACGKTMAIGVAAPITGAASSIGVQQLHWAQFAVAKWNKSGARPKFKIVQGDTQLPNVAEAIKVAKTFASDKQLWGSPGRPVARRSRTRSRSYKAAGLAFISGSATRTSLTDGRGKGYFFRVVPNDDVQGPTVGEVHRRAR